MEKNTKYILGGGLLIAILIVAFMVIRKNRLKRKSNSGQGMGGGASINSQSGTAAIGQSITAAPGNTNQDARTVTSGTNTAVSNITSGTNTQGEQTMNTSLSDARLLIKDNNSIQVAQLLPQGVSFNGFSPDGPQTSNAFSIAP